MAKKAGIGYQPTDHGVHYGALLKVTRRFRLLDTHQCTNSTEKQKKTDTCTKVLHDHLRALLSKAMESEKGAADLSLRHGLYQQVLQGLTTSPSSSKDKFLHVLIKSPHNFI